MKKQTIIDPMAVAAPATKKKGALETAALPKTEAEKLDRLAEIKRQIEALEGEAAPLANDLKDHCQTMFVERTFNKLTENFNVKGVESVAAYITPNKPKILTEEQIDALSQRWGKKAEELYEREVTASVNMEVYFAHEDEIKKALNKHLDPEVLKQLFKPKVSIKPTKDALKDAVGLAKTPEELKDLYSTLGLVGYLKFANVKE